MILKLYILKSKINFLGFILCLASFIFEAQINDFANYFYQSYSPDCGQYIVLNLGLVLSFYKPSSLDYSLLSVFFSFRLCDELFFDDNIINYLDFIEIISIFVLAYYSFKNFKYGAKTN